MYIHTCNHTHINIILSPSPLYIYKYIHTHMYSTPFLYDPVSLHSPHPRSYYRNHLSCPILYGVEPTIRLEDHHYCPLTRHYHCLHPHLNPKHMCSFICFIMCFSWIGETLQQSDCDSQGSVEVLRGHILLSPQGPRAAARRSRPPRPPAPTARGRALHRHASIAPGRRPRRRKRRRCHWRSSLLSNF